MSAHSDGRRFGELIAADRVQFKGRLDLDDAELAELAGNCAEHARGLTPVTAPRWRSGFCAGFTAVARRHGART